MPHPDDRDPDVPDPGDRSAAASPARPQWTPTQRELDDLDLISTGAIAPIDGFVNPHSQGASRGPIPAVTLTVPSDVADQAEAAGEIELTDPEGTPLATVDVSERWDAGPGRTGIAGRVKVLARNEFGAFRRLFLSPDRVRDAAFAAGAHRILAVPVTAPLTVDDLNTIRDAARNGARPTLLAYVGEGSPRGVSAAGLIRCTLAAADLLGGHATVVAVPLAARGDEAADAWLHTHVAHVYGDDAVFVPGASLDPSREVHDDLPERVRAIVELDRPSRARQGIVVFFTGLSGSGKSTLARALHDVILERGDRTVTLLDGDVVRRHLSAGLGFSREDRETNIARIGFVAAEISRHHGVAICSPIAPFDSTRQRVRAMVEAAGGAFCLIHVSTPLEECERRDRKGLYAKARAGEIPDFTGISSPYEVPDDVTARVDTTGRSIEEALGDVLTALRDGGWLAGPVREAQ